MPAFTDYSMKGRTYRYLDRKPLYPFGYGLTYGNVKVKEVQVSTEDGVSLQIQVKNEGIRATEDVVEVYIKNLESAYAVKNHSLCGFARVELEPGEEKKIEISIPESAFMVIDDSGEKRRDGNRFRLSAGTSQPDERSFELTGIHPVEVEIEI